MKPKKTDLPTCGHTIFNTDCKHCMNLQSKWYDKLAKEGFKDLEYGQEDASLLYQPVNLDAINPEATAFYDSVWSVYHSWVAEGRPERDLVVAELLAKQEGKTGTSRGIAAYLKTHKLAPWSRTNVDLTIKEIRSIISAKTKPTTPK